jgi:hypothetical protein
MQTYIIGEHTNLKREKRRGLICINQSRNLFTECAFIGSVIGARHLGAELGGFRPAACSPRVTHYRARSRRAYKTHRAQTANFVFYFIICARLLLLLLLHLTAFCIQTLIKETRIPAVALSRSLIAF